MKESTRKSLSTAIYVRVSTEEQAQEGYSIRGQTEKLKAYAMLKEWDIFDIYADEGISGKNIVYRPAINRLIDDVESGKVNNVLVFKVDRLTRSTKNLLELTELFEECNCNFNSLTESIDTETPSGRMFLKIIGIFAEFERENLASRLKLGFERKVKEGYTLAGNTISYGYTRKKGQKVQTIDPNEANIVRDIFTMFVRKNSPITRIARILNERKVPTKENTTWQTTGLKRIIMNPVYIGKVRYSTKDDDNYFEADGHHEPIISNELFYLAQEKIKNNARAKRTKHPKENNYFCGFLICEKCNSKYTTHNYSYESNGGEKRHKTSYKCSSKASADVVRCENYGISHAKMEIAFCEYIKKIRNITEYRTGSTEEKAKNAQQEMLKNIVDCEKRMNDLQIRKNHVMQRLVQGGIEFDEYKNIVGAFNENYNILENDLQIKKAELASVTQTPAISPEDIIKNIKENWEELSNSERMIFLQRFIKKISITVERINGNTNTVKINDIEFHTGELPKREMIGSSSNRVGKW